MHPTPLPPAGHQLAARSTGPRLLQDTPLVALLEEMNLDLTRQLRLEPNGGSRHTLEHYAGRLSSALAEAARGDTWVSAEEAARLRGCTTQAITALCRQDKLKARKRGGTWEIHRDSVLRDTRGTN